MLLGLHEAPPAELRFVWICRVVSFQLFRAFWGLELLPGPTRKSRVWGLDQSKKLVHTFCAGWSCVNVYVHIHIHRNSIFYRTTMPAQLRLKSSPPSVATKHGTWKPLWLSVSDVIHDFLMPLYASTHTHKHVSTKTSPCWELALAPTSSHLQPLPPLVERKLMVWICLAIGPPQQWIYSFPCYFTIFLFRHFLEDQLCKNPMGFPTFANGKPM